MATAKRKRKTSGESRFQKNRSNKKGTLSASQPSLRGADLELAVEQFQAEPDAKKAHEQWKQIETSVFGVHGPSA
jgi:hypothetical protein